MKLTYEEKECLLNGLDKAIEILMKTKSGIESGEMSWIYITKEEYKNVINVLDSVKESLKTILLLNLTESWKTEK